MMKKQLIALGVASVLLASALVGCGNGGGNNPVTKGSAESASGTTDTGMKNISIMTVDFNGSAMSADGSEEVIKRMEAYTNTHVDFTWAASDSYEDKLGVMLMDKSNMPMILTALGTSLNSTMVQAAKADAFWDLTEYLKDSEKYPNLSQANENVLKALTVDGKIIGIYRARPIGRNGLGYRKDWADKLGLEEPKTIEDVYNMAKAFTEQDPDGNGKNDTYGLSLSKAVDSFDIVQAWFGAGNGWVLEDEKLKPSFETEGYMEALDWFKKMYNEGLVFEDFAVRDASTRSDALKNGQCGMLVDVLDESRRIWDYFVNNEIPAMNGDETASMGLVGSIAKEGGDDPVTLATAGMNGYFVITKAAAKTEEDVEACLSYLDKMCDNEMLVLADYGIEGISYELDEEGKIVMGNTLELTQQPNNGLNQVLCYIPNAASTDPVIKRTERQELEEKVKAENVERAVYNPGAGYLANSETYSMNGGNLDQSLIDARIQYICGQIDKAGLEKAWKNWSDLGGEKIIEQVNALYNADK
ncbi:MAG: extracellular solute-binding protein [Anaerocolumna sp.]